MNIEIFKRRDSNLIFWKYKRGNYIVVSVLYPGEIKMTQNKFTFESKELSIDYISFKFQYLDKLNISYYQNFLLN